MELSDNKNFLVSKVNMLLSKGRNGMYNGIYGEMIDQRPLLQSLQCNPRPTTLYIFCNEVNRFDNR